MTSHDEQSVLPLPLPHGQPTDRRLPQQPSSPQSPPPAEGPTLAIPERMLPGLGSNLFIQAHTSEAADAATVISHGGVGAVYTVPHRRYRSHFHEALRAVHATRQVAPGADLLLDRNRYSGNQRADASDPMDRRWVEDQLGVLQLPWALADPGFCRTTSDVQLVLDDARRLPERVIVPLAMPHELLCDDADTLLTRVNDQKKPVAVILEHKADPFSTTGVATGLTRLIHGATVPVLLLRTDTSALGAISHGAAAGAIGAHSGLRHVYPETKGDGGHPEHLSFVVPDLLTYVLGDRFARTYEDNPDPALWRCNCWFCHGRDLSWIDTEPAAFADAFQHSVAAIADLGAQLHTHLATMTPVEAWDLMCTTAQIAHDEVANPSGSPWAPQRFLANWHLANTGTPSAEQPVLERMREQGFFPLPSRRHSPRGG